MLKQHIADMIPISSIVVPRICKFHYLKKSVI